LVEQRTFNP